MDISSLDPVAAFLAKGGTITRVASGASSGLTNRDWYNATRGNVTASNERVMRQDDNALIEQRRVIGDVVTNGLGEIIGTI